MATKAKYLDDKILLDALLMSLNAVDFAKSHTDRLIATGMAMRLDKQMNKEFDRLERRESL